MWYGNGRRTKASSEGCAQPWYGPRGGTSHFRGLVPSGANQGECLAATTTQGGWCAATRISQSRSVAAAPANRVWYGFGSDILAREPLKSGYLAYCGCQSLPVVARNAVGTGGPVPAFDASYQRLVRHSQAVRSDSVRGGLRARPARRPPLWPLISKPFSPQVAAGTALVRSPGAP